MCDTDPTREMRQSTFSRFSAASTEAPDEPGETPPTETTLIIKKVETGTNTPLSGALFEVKAPDGTVLGSFASDANGKVVLPLTLSGQYVITEKVAPKWHLLGKETTKTVSVTYGNTATVTFENAPYGNLRVEKIDADSGDHLAGAKVEIKHIETGAVYTSTTDLAGSAYFDRLLPGAYQVRELAAPYGWVMDGQTRTINVVSGTEVSIALENKAKPGLTILKYDEATKTPLPDVAFEVYRDTVLIGTFMTNELGEIRLANLQPGTYLVKEVSTDPDHVLNSTPQQIELTAGDGIRRLTFLNSLIIIPNRSCFPPVAATCTPWPRLRSRLAASAMTARRTAPTPPTAGAKSIWTIWSRGRIRSLRFPRPSATFSTPPSAMWSCSPVSWPSGILKTSPSPTCKSSRPTPLRGSLWRGYCCPGSGSYRSLIPGGGAHYGLTVTGIGEDARKLVQALEDGKLVIAIMAKGHFTRSGHFIVLRGITADGRILVADPASVKRSNQTWPLSIITGEVSHRAGSGGPFWTLES